MVNLIKLINKIKIVSVLFLSVSISSCSGVYKKGNELTKLMYEEKSNLSANNISKREIISRYSNPSHRWKDIDDNEVYNYQYVAIKPFFHAYIPIISIFIRPSEKINIYDISITFNKNGEMIHTSFFSKEDKI